MSSYIVGYIGMSRPLPLIDVVVDDGRHVKAVVTMPMGFRQSAVAKA